ncbi:hypothetical protein C825_000020 [Parabacteroides sp. ASF519]|nr:hypothetical protein C825_000020 [Parabacteroides sp. ASF519]
MLCYDYRDMTFHEDLSSYKEIHLIAWSMGAYGRTGFSREIRTNHSYRHQRHARPIDDNFGIPENIFRGTLDNLTAEGMKRFNRRMCGSRDILAQHEKFPARPLEEVKDELQHIYNLVTANQ